GTGNLWNSPIAQFHQRRIRRRRLHLQNGTPMSTFNIAVLPGDYIGPEITAEARRVLDAVGKRFGHSFQYKEALAGGAAYDAFGEHLPQSTLDTCAAADAIMKGPMGGPRDQINHPKWQGVEQNAILPLRKYFDLYLNLR